MTRFELMKMRAENVRSSFSAASIIFGSVIGFLIANGLQDKSLTIGQKTALLTLWLFSLAGIPQTLLKTAENIVWHVPWRSTLSTLVCVAVPAVLFGYYQKTVPLDPNVWAALIPTWIVSTLFVAVIERPSEKELDHE